MYMNTTEVCLCVSRMIHVHAWVYLLYFHREEGKHYTETGDYDKCKCKKKTRKFQLESVFPVFTLFGRLPTLLRPGDICRKFCFVGSLVNDHHTLLVSSLSKNCMLKLNDSRLFRGGISWTKNLINFRLAGSMDSEQIIASQRSFPDFCRKERLETWRRD